MARSITHAFRRAAATGLASILGAAAAIAASAIVTLAMSVAVCLGLHPELATASEWAAVVAGLVWAGAIVRRAGIAASIGAGVVVMAAWVLTWLYLMGRFDTHLWASEALPGLSWQLILAWLSAPAFSLAGGLLRTHLRRRALPVYVLALALVIAAVLLSWAQQERPGDYALQGGRSVSVAGPDREGTTVRLLTFDFAEDPRLSIHLYDRDCDDSHPFDDRNTSYLGTPAASVFDRSPSTVCVVNAGFFMWTECGRLGSHVAPVVIDGRAHYDLLNGPKIWTFGWKNTESGPQFRLMRGVPFESLPEHFDAALTHVRPLVVHGRAPRLAPGAGVTTMRCSRTSLGWSRGSSKLYLLVVRDPDGERASIGQWKADRTKQVGGWDLNQVQRFWVSRGITDAVALDGGDSTQIVYRGPRGTKSIGSARFSVTLGYWRDRPIRLWIPILPTRHADVGVMNYLCVERMGS